MDNVLEEVGRVARETGKPEAEVLLHVLKAGLRDVRRERVLDQYLLDEISREEAVLQVGQDWVEMAERQRRAVEGDLKWALEGE